MKISCPKAYSVTLCLVVYLALYLAAAPLAAETGEAESARAETFRANLLTPYEERVVGQRMAYLYEQRHVVLRDAEGEARISRIKARLGARILSETLEIKIIRSARAEAMSFPQGHIYLTSALVKLASTDEELAAVIAHEAAHIRGRHLSRLIAMTLTLPVDEQTGFPTRRAIVTGQALRFAFPSQLDGERLRCEMEADEMALHWLESAGYDKSALAQILESISARLWPDVQQEQDSLKSRIALLKERAVLQK